MRYQHCVHHHVLEAILNLSLFQLIQALNNKLIFQRHNLGARGSIPPYISVHA